MKPNLPHPLYDFHEDFTPRPKAVEPRGINIPLILGISLWLLCAVIVVISFFWR